MYHCHLHSAVVGIASEVEGKNGQVQWHALLICHCHLLPVVETKCVSDVKGKNEDTSSSVTCIIDVPLSLTRCSGRDSVSEVEGKNEDTSSTIICIIDGPLSLTPCSGKDRQSVLVKLKERVVEFNDMHY